MEKLRVLNIRFNNEMRIDDMPRLRGAIVKKIGEEKGNAHIDFHNHKQDKVVYRYPRIQYKILNERAAIVCVNHGTDSIHEFLALDDYEIQLGNEKVNLSIDYLLLKQYRLQIWDSYFSYRIHHWLALNEDNYKAYLKLENEDEKIFFLEKILTGNLWGFTKNMGYELDKKIKLNISKIRKERVKPYKDIRMHAITADFRTNIYIPPNIGLGKGVSVGFGIVAPNRNNERIESKKYEQ